MKTPRWSYEKIAAVSAFVLALASIGLNIWMLDHYVPKRLQAPIAYHQETDTLQEVNHVAFYGTSAEITFTKNKDDKWDIRVTVDPERHTGRPPMWVYKDHDVIIRTDFEAMEAARTAPASRTP